MPGRVDSGKKPTSLNLELPDEIVDEIARRVALLLADQLHLAENEAASDYLSVVEAAEVLRARRHRVDDLLSRGVLTRIKDGSRTLIARKELEDYLAGKPTGRASR
jgi:excisionase family DNA binding protein